jgi:phosphoribosylformimino-5-aminoimidazole carboxamide ribotide isomerase
MKLFLAMDLRQNLVVHGKSGQRETYKPLDWGISPTAEPLGYIRTVRPKYLYIADLDRIEGTGSHDGLIRRIAKEVRCCFVDRGCRFPQDFLNGDTIVNIVGTETGGSNLSRYRGGFLSIDIKNDRVIPCGKTPSEVLASARRLDFDGCILLNVSAVGTGQGISRMALKQLKKAYDRPLYYGGGVATTADLEEISRSGFDGAIVSTAVHRGTIPVDWIRRGSCC